MATCVIGLTLSLRVPTWQEKSDGTVGDWFASILGEKWLATSSKMLRQNEASPEFGPSSSH